MSAIDVVVSVGMWIWANKDSVGLTWAEIFHGVTNVKRWRNETDEELEVWKLDGGESRQDHYRIPPGGTEEADMWIPWADDASQYAVKHAVILIGGRPLAYLWQNGTKIRFNTNDEFVPGGQAVPGAAKAGGNRTILVKKDAHGRLGFAIGGY
ncbi:hypothetical protein [Paractinoplanes rishiriensis]|uniref:Uncharacterized protein n=1 Tax=Paractinoplanes rishiriensis TaxID=1050105 RepID=A0A919N097_9ACTN|nr:hypothetical protein [Actinoplanes rishiriensis]GIF02280.1 hypothetical protein Ari01nite_97440 [Actinoplanes rishiriensis]